jgi:hypothetical protein
VGLAAAVRFVTALYLGDTVTPQPGTADQVSYHTLALRVLDGHGFTFGTGWWPATNANEPTAHWSYLYVLFLAGVYSVFGPHPVMARIIQAVAVGALQPWLTFLVARRLFGARVALVAAALVAGYAYFVYYAGALMTESFFIAALIWSVHAAMRVAEPRRPEAGPAGLARWFVLGLALATAILLRQAFVVCVPAILLWITWRLLRRDGSALRGPEPRALGVAAHVGLTLAVVAVAILPWTVRNWRAFNEFVLLNTNAGFAFYWGNHPIHGNRFIPILPGDGSLYGTLIPDELRDLNEAQMDRALLRRGLGFVAQDPGRYLRLSASRAVEYFKFWPSPHSDRLSNLARGLSFGLCAPFMLAGVYLATRRPMARCSRHRAAGRAEVWLLLGVAFVYSLAHLLTWTLVRYRLPVDGLLLPFSALAVVSLQGRLTHGACAPRDRRLAAPAEHIALTSSNEARPS